MFFGEIESTLISVCGDDIPSVLRNAVDILERQGRFLVAALMVLQIECAPIRTRYNSTAAPACSPNSSPVPVAAGPQTGSPRIPAGHRPAVRPF